MSSKLAHLNPFFVSLNASSDAAVRKPSLYTLQIGRGLAALAVLLYHANLTIGLPKYYGTNPANLFLPGRVGADYFFVLSGFVMVIAHWRDLQGPADPASFLWKRFRRLYPLLWVVLMPLMVLIAIEPSFSPAGDVRTWDFLSALAILPADRPANAEPFLVVEWTLRYEIVFYALFLVLLISRAVFAGLALVLVVLGGVSLGLQAEPEGFWIAPYFLLFFMGMAGGVIYKKGAIARPRWLACGGLVLLAAGLWVGRSGFFSPILIATIGLGAALIITGAAAAERGRPSWVASGFIFLGDASYSLYLVHYPLLSLTTKLMVHITASPILAFILAVALALAGGIVCHLLVERPLLQRLPRTMKRSNLQPESA